MLEYPLGTVHDSTKVTVAEGRSAVVVFHASVFQTVNKSANVSAIHLTLIGVSFGALVDLHATIPLVETLVVGQFKVPFGSLRPAVQSASNQPGAYFCCVIPGKLVQILSSPLLLGVTPASRAKEGSVVSRIVPVSGFKIHVLAYWHSTEMTLSPSKAFCLFPPPMERQVLSRPETM